MGIIFPFFAMLFVDCKAGFKVAFFTACIGAGVMLGLINYLVAKMLILKDLNHSVDALEQLAHSDDTKQMVKTAERKDELGRLARAFNTLAERLELCVRKTSELSIPVLKSEHEIAGLMEILVKHTQDMNNATCIASEHADEATKHATQVQIETVSMSTNTERVSLSISEMNNSLSEVASNCQKEAAIASEADKRALAMREIMARLNESASQIGKVVTVIDDIAAQTNLLALNATIEAASAGEAGRGFAVVANEVKELSKQTTRATQEVSEQIDGMQISVNEAQASIKTISEIIEQFHEIANSIAASVEQQSSSIREISNNMHELSASFTNITKKGEDSTRVLTSSQEQLSLAKEASHRSVSEVGNLKTAVSKLAIASRNLGSIFGTKS
ncbi:MAG: methyl-accepting chemotaxis protein [Fibrobacteres bacterium]|nr:methyl-accepting chemotaxis protein [Fibrobacterota bacterium]